MKLNGYRASHRNKWYFIRHGILSIQELALLEYYADIFCFNSAQPNYGVFTVKFEETANIFHCKSDTTVRNWHKKLLEVGFIEATDNQHVFKLICCGRYIGQSLKIKGEANKYQALEHNQPIETILQSFGIDFQSIGKNFQPIGIENNEKVDISAQTKSLATDSYKDSDTTSSIGSKKVVVIKQETRSDAEYTQIQNETSEDFRLSIEDMRWIDQNAMERIVVESDEQEKEIVRIYFNGDLNKYRKNLLVNY